MEINESTETTYDYQDEFIRLYAVRTNESPAPRLEITDKSPGNPKVLTVKPGSMIALAMFLYEVVPTAFPNRKGK